MLKTKLTKWQKEFLNRRYGRLRFPPKRILFGQHRRNIYKILINNPYLDIMTQITQKHKLCNHALPFLALCECNIDIFRNDRLLCHDLYKTINAMRDLGITLRLSPELYMLVIAES